MRRSWILTISVLVLAILAARPAGAAAADADEASPPGANGLANPNFDTGVAGWNADQTWDPKLDADGNPHSGSVRLSAVLHPAGCINAAQCLVVTPGLYELSAKVFVPTGTYPDGALAETNVIWVKRADCMWGAESPALGNVSTPFFYLDASQNTWVRITTGLTVAPEETHSAWVYLNVCASALGKKPATLTVNFDDIVLKKIEPAKDPPAAQ